MKRSYILLLSLGLLTCSYAYAQVMMPDSGPKPGGGVPLPQQSVVAPSSVNPTSMQAEMPAPTAPGNTQFFQIDAKSKYPACTAKAGRKCGIVLDEDLAVTMDETTAADCAAICKSTIVRFSDCKVANQGDKSVSAGYRFVAARGVTGGDCMLGIDEFVFTGVLGNPMTKPLCKALAGAEEVYCKNVVIK